MVRLADSDVRDSTAGGAGAPNRDSTAGGAGAPNRDDALRAMHVAAMQGLNRSSSFPDGVRAVLQAVGTALGWAGGEYWEVGTDRAVVNRVARWVSPHRTGSAGPLGDPSTEPEKLSLPLATGLPGAVWADDGEVWVGDVGAEPGDPRRARLARESGLTTAITVPVTTKDHPGVLLFLTPDRPDDPPPLRFALQSIGAHVGQFAECCRGNDALREERRRLQEAQRMARVGSWEWDLTTDEVIWADIMYELYGVDPDECTPAEANARCIHPDDRESVFAAFRQCVAGETLVWRYRVIRQSDGQTRIFEARGGAVSSDGDTPTRITGTTMDVTELDRAAELMAEARDAAMTANAAKSAFLATMSHEIRTPMNAVIGMTDLLLETSLDPRQQEYVETIRTSGDALLAVINDILDFSRIEAGEMDLEMRPFELRRCVEDSLALVANRATGLDLVSHVEANCPQYVVGDVNRLRQVLVNLVGNAVKFTTDGDVLVSVSPAAPADPDDDQVRLSFRVRDTGIGIPPERMDRLFRSFSQIDASTTRVYGGSGLGLAISQAIVQSMAGEITVTSTVGVGSEFSFEIGLARCPAPPAELGDAGLADPVVDLSGRRVLVVDDNDTNRRILRIQLETWGMTCTAVASPRGALAVLAEGPGFDIAVLDMHMPETDGAQLAELIRRMPAGEHLPMILLTSLATRPPVQEESLFAGFHTKPIRAGALQSLLGQVLAPRRTAASAPPTTPGPGPVALRILLAEDNVVNQMVAQRLLHNLGHYVDIAGDGQEAVEAVLKRDYDVVLMDIHMPHLDGLDATRAIRSRIPAARQPQIIAMTASSLPEDRRACTEAGMNGYLLKPVRMADLVDSLHALLPGTGRPASLPPTVADVPVTGTPVDLAVLHQLSLDMGATSAQTRRDLVEAYLEQADAWIPELAAAAQAGDRERIRVITHTLGSSSALLGAQPLADLLTEAGRRARTEGTDLVTAVAAAQDEYRLVAMVLNANQEALTGPAGRAW